MLLLPVLMTLGAPCLSVITIISFFFLKLGVVFRSLSLLTVFLTDNKFLICEQISRRSWYLTSMGAGGFWEAHGACLLREVVRFRRGWVRREFHDLPDAIELFLSAIEDLALCRVDLPSRYLLFWLVLPWRPDLWEEVYICECWEVF